MKIISNSKCKKEQQIIKKNTVFDITKQCNHLLIQTMIYGFCYFFVANPFFLIQFAYCPFFILLIRLSYSC